jgi:holo-[acyl-carrier protein] synthase
LGTGIRGISWHDIEIISGETGEPEVFLSEKARQVAVSRGCSEARVSLSHDQTQAAAMAIIF